MAEIGVVIAEEVLGREIFEKLWVSESQRTLRIQLPGATEEENHLAAALARVPWEIARPDAVQPTLNDRNLLIRVVHDMKAPASQPLELKADEDLRVLFVFAEARGSNPLGMRQERLELMRLLEHEVYPKRRVMAHFLSHGVTRERLASQIQEQGGYHLVHWSGHGHHNLLELAKAGGASDHLSGQDLLDLFIEAGGFLPRLFFLSACHSGDILRVRDWNDFIAVAQGKELGSREAAPQETKKLDLEQQPGFTGTAHALLQGGVPSVVAMRYAVGDDYARELAVEFYRALLAHPQPKSAAAALNLARKAMLDTNKHDPARIHVCDHATPVFYGAEQPGLTPAPGRSPALNPRDPRLHQINELTPASHAHFVGRTWELAGLGADFIGSRAGAEVKPVAVITGLGGMGKTALVAEALALWQTNFEWVLLYQAKPNALGFEATLRDIHQILMGELGRYHHHIKARPADAIYRDADEHFTGPERQARLTRNLLRALKDEAILLVLDNFETNLKPPVADSDHTAAACQDPAWDHCLGLLARDLGGSPSRLLITSRRPLAALESAGDNPATHPVRLGPLPAAEAALYLRTHRTLSRMVFGTDAGERRLAQRLLYASRFHPLLMDRLAKLAEPTLRGQLLQALDTLESTRDYARLPARFATRPGDEKELAYLGDALTISIDQLIRAASRSARQVLWLIAVANEPVALGLLESVWRGEDSPQQAKLRQLKQVQVMLPLLPPGMQVELKAKLPLIPPEIRSLLETLPAEAPERRELAPLRHQLLSVGLVTEERSGPDDANPDLTCHELVRERIRTWMRQQDQGEWTENSIRLAYAGRLEAVFDDLKHQDMRTALQAGSRALVYVVQAEDWERLGDFASEVVTSSRDPRLMAGLIPHLRTAAESAPEGRLRWYCLTTFADALRQSNSLDASLPFYEQAHRLASAAVEAGGPAVPQAWADLAWISGNWALALVSTGHPDAARQRHLESAAAHQQAGRPAIYVIGGELEALRINVKQGQVDTAWPEVESRLAQVAHWWRLQRAGQPVPEAPDAEFLARTYLSALDIAKDADFARVDWTAALGRIETMLEIQVVLLRPVEDIAVTRMNRANVLGKLEHYSEARAELEDCLTLFQNDPVHTARIRSSLANLFAQQDDLPQAITQQRRALARRETLPAPADRANSHDNLAIYLERHGTPPDLAESPRHRHTALIYRLVAGLGQDLQTSLRNYAVSFRRAHTAGTELVVPRVADLLVDPVFAPLEQWLRQRQVDMAELQTDVDQHLDHVRQIQQQRVQSKQEQESQVREQALIEIQRHAEEIRGRELMAEPQHRSFPSVQSRQEKESQAREQALIEEIRRSDLMLMRGLDIGVRQLPPTSQTYAPVVIPRMQPVHLPGTERMIVAAAEAEAGLVYPVWFGTNRRPDGRGGFGGERHDRTTRGRAEVFVPEAHRFGETGTPFWKKLLRFDLRDDTLRLQRITTQARDAWLGEIRQAMQAATDDGKTPHAVFFLHGYNVSFEEAAIRAAQIGVDLGMPGATAFFSWPSRGEVAAYPVDEASIEASEAAITDFLVDFVTHCGAEKVHVIAHSMGNRGLLRALQRIAANAETRGQVKFGQVFLAAPDVDRDLFLSLARLYPEHAQRTTLYASGDDLPVHLSSKFHDAPRAGYYPPYTVTPGVDTVAVPDFDLDLLGHAYFAQAEALLYHMRDLMLNGQATVTSNRLHAALEGGASFWKLKR